MPIACWLYELWLVFLTGQYKWGPRGVGQECEWVALLTWKSLAVAAAGPAARLRSASGVRASGVTCVCFVPVCVGVWVCTHLCNMCAGQAWGQAVYKGLPLCSTELAGGQAG
jgi:hypothetical protein